MNEYCVVFDVIGLHEVSVEADSIDEAKEKAEKMTKDKEFSGLLEVDCFFNSAWKLNPDGSQSGLRSTNKGLMI